jgi:WD40 repeat protein
MLQTEELAKRFAPTELLTLTADPQVMSARFHPTRSLLYAGGFDGRVRRWQLDGEAPVELAPLAGHNGWVDAIAFSPDGSRFYSADSWGQIRCWSLDGDQAELVWSDENAHAGWVRDLALSPDGSRLVSCGRDAMIHIRDAMTGNKIVEPKQHSYDVFQVEFCPTGETFVVGDERGTVIVFSPDGEKLRSIDASKLYLEHRLQDVGGVRALAFNDKGTTLAVGGTVPKNGATVQGIPTVLVFDYSTGDEQHVLSLGATSHCFVHEVKFHAEGFLMAVTSGTPGQGQVIFQVPGEEKPFFLHTKISNCHSISYHQATDRFAVAGTNRGSNGNGRPLGKEGEYAGNNSPIHVFRLSAEV